MAGYRDADWIHSLGLQEAYQVLALLTAAGEHRPRGNPVGQQCPGDVYPLAARVDVGRRRPDDLAPRQPLHVDRTIQARVEGKGDDHARITRTPSASTSDTRSSLRPESVIRRSTSESTPNRDR